jgi:hemolysin III
MLTVAWPRLPLSTTACLTVYGAATVAMFGFSAAYNLIPMRAWKDPLRRCDQAAIFVKIAATYTPFAVTKMGGPWGVSLLTLVWSVALLGAGAKLLGTQWEKLSLALYLSLGWSGLLFIQPLFEAIPSDALMLLGLGGATYTVGVLFHVWERLPYQNAIWHFFVLTGTCLHFAAVFAAVIPT